MNHPWTPQHALEPVEALRIIQEQFPNLGATHIRLCGAGWDNTAFVVNEEMLFRFPRREIALPLLEAEWCGLPKIAPHLPFPIPVPQWKGKPTANFPWPFIGYPMLPGNTACTINLSEQERAAFAIPLAEFLSALHAISPKEIADCPIPGDNQSRIDGALLTPKIEKNFEELSLLGLLENKKELYAAVAENQNFRPPVSTSIVHGDFYVRHLLVNAQHHLSGVIDWGDLHIGDPAIDLAIVHSFLPIDAHANFRRAYGEIDDATWALAKLRAISSNTWLLLFGHHSKDLDLLREGARALRVMTQNKKV